MVQSVTANPATLTVKAGETATFTVGFNPVDATNKKHPEKGFDTRSVGFGRRFEGKNLRIVQNEEQGKERKMGQGIARTAIR